MRRVASLVCLLCSTLLFSLPTLASDVQHSAPDFHTLYGDFDGDDRLDALEVSHRSGLATRFLSDVAGSNTPTELSFNIDPSTQYLVAGDFDNDDKDEFMVLDASLEGEYYLLDDSLQLVEGDEKLRIKGYNDNRKIDFTHLYRGDFNGDTVDDLLAYAAGTHDIVVFHNKDNANKIKFRFDAQLTLDNPSPLTVKIRDLNEDGMEDIVLLSEQAGGGTFVAFAGKKGKFKKSDFEDITPFLGGEDFSNGHMPLHFWSDGETEETVLVRPGATPWGFDEEGNQLTDAEAEAEAENDTGAATANRAGIRTQNSSDTTQNNNQDNCSRLRYSPLRKVVESACGAHSEADSDSDSATSVATLSVSSPGAQISASAPATPAWVNADADGDKMTISWAGVSGIDYYNREVSINYGGWQNTKKYPSTQTSVIFENQQARTYRYQVRACIEVADDDDNCSGWRVSNYETVHAHTPPPATPGAAPTISGGNYHPFNSSGISVNMPWVSGAYSYKLYIGTSSSNTVEIKTTTSGTTSFTPNISWGFLYVRYTACNLVACSDKSPWQRIKIYNMPGKPNNVTLSTSTVYAGGSATFSWTAAGGMIPNGFYKIIETRPGGAPRQIWQLLAGHQSAYSHTVSPGNVPGNYQYRVQPCNPGFSCNNSPPQTLNQPNRVPVTVNESYSVNEGSAQQLYVMNNDNDPDGHALSISGFTQPANGSVSCTASSCRFSATNSISSNLSSSFTYTVTDGYGGFATGNVVVTVINQPEGTTATPSISPQGGTFSGSQTVSISNTTPGATIYYTLNGTTPSRSSTVYSGPFTVTNTTTVRAFAAAHDYYDSGQASQTFTLGATDVVIRYRYDALGRLVKVVDPQNGERDYEYDKAGNRSSVTKQNP